MESILGAGLSGLICGALNAQAYIFERNPSSFTSHRAVLRFRTNAIGRALGMDFREVEVRKAIWYGGTEAQPSIRLANFYSRKVRGVIAPSSIWNLAPSTRYIAPDDLHARLAEICGKRVEWDCAIDFPQLTALRERGRVTSTIPLPLLLDILNIPRPFPFEHSPICVSRYRIPNCDVFQTIYYPDPRLEIYRATLTGSLLTIESIGGQINGQGLALVLQSFGLPGDSVGDTELHNHKQSFGKIAPVPDGPRKALLHALTTQFGIYSLGRFATWRNILLDDVFNDIYAIRRMSSLATYDQNLERMKS